MNIGLLASEIGVEKRDSVSWACAILIAGCPRQQHDLVCDLRGRGPDLLAAHEVTARNPLGEGLDAGGVKAGIRFGETEAALIFTRDQPRNPAGFLVPRALHADRM